MNIGINLAITRGGKKGSTAPVISLSNSNVDENTPAGSTIGTLSVINGTGTYTFTITADTDSKFAISSPTLKTAGTWDYESATSHQVTIHADNGAGSTLDRTFTVQVNNITATLNALTLSASTIAEGSAADTVVGTLQNTTVGSSLSLTDTAGGRFKLVSGVIKADSVATDYESATSHNITVRETYSEGTNSPRDTTLTISVTNVLEVTLAALTLSSSSVDTAATVGTVVGAIQNKSSGSSIVLTDDAGGKFAISGTNIVTAATFSGDETDSITIRETHSDGNNSPRDTTLSISVSSGSFLLLADGASFFLLTNGTDRLLLADPPSGGGGGSPETLTTVGGTILTDDGGTSLTTTG